MINQDFANLVNKIANTEDGTYRLSYATHYCDSTQRIGHSTPKVDCGYVAIVIYSPDSYWSYWPEGDTARELSNEELAYIQGVVALC